MHGRYMIPKVSEDQTPIHEVPLERLIRRTANTLVRLAYNNQTTPDFIPPVTYDFACPLVLAPGGPDMAGLQGVKNLTELGGGSEVGY